MAVFFQPGDNGNAGGALIVAEVANGLLRFPALRPHIQDLQRYALLQAATVQGLVAGTAP